MPIIIAFALAAQWFLVFLPNLAFVIEAPAAAIKNNTQLSQSTALEQIAKSCAQGTHAKMFWLSGLFLIPTEHFTTPIKATPKGRNRTRKVALN